MMILHCDLHFHREVFLTQCCVSVFQKYLHARFAKVRINLKIYMT